MERKDAIRDMAVSQMRGDCERGNRSEQSKLGLGVEVRLCIEEGDSDSEVGSRCVQVEGARVRCSSCSGPEMCFLEARAVKREGLPVRR